MKLVMLVLGGVRWRKPEFGSLRIGVRGLACGAAVLPILCGTVSCGHSIRASRGTLERLRRSGDHFVLVFGSLSTPGANLDRPVIRFLHPESSGNPGALLWSTTIATGKRFYAVLRPPPPAEYLDEIYVEVGSERSGFDRIIYAHMREDEEPLAMYVGELEVRPASTRGARGQKVVVETRDDFQQAQRELRHLYPDFDRVINRVTPAPK